MQNLDDELLHAIDELCTQLFQCASSDDAAPVLRAMAALASTSRSAQKVCGQALVSDAGTVPGKRLRRVVRLSRLADRFLYDPTSALTALALLAVLAHGNLVNQRRIARLVTTIAVSVPTLSALCPVGSAIVRPTETLHLLVLSLPTPLRRQYEQWRARHRDLQGRRVPAGTPPARDGVPAPCLCNECLGSPQFLATWIDHYEDLSRWSKIGGTDDEMAASYNLSGVAFLQKVLLTDYDLVQYPCLLILGDPVDEIRIHTAHQGGSTHAPAIVFFFPKNEPRCIVSPDPLRHVCAIEVDEATFAETSRVSRRDHRVRPHECADGDSIGEGEDLDRVVLLERKAQLPHCELPFQVSHAVSSRRWSSGMIRFLQPIEGRHQETVTQLQTDVETTRDLETRERVLLTAILGYLDPAMEVDRATLSDVLLVGADELASRHEGPRLYQNSQKEQESASGRLCAVSMVASYRRQVIQVVVIAEDGERFTAILGLAEFCPEAGSAMNICNIDEDSLVTMLSYCRLCTHASEGRCGNHEGWIHLLPTPPIEQEASVPHTESTAEVVPHQPTLRERGINHQEDKISARGLSTGAERSVGELRDALSSPQDALVAVTARSIRRIVSDCNERMTELACTRGLTEPQRRASRERCRLCRDLLIQAGKRMKLGANESEHEKLSLAAASRLRRALVRVLQLSQSTDPWETPDERVKLLDLNRHVWASGVPDPEYFVETAARAKANRTAQRRLNHRIVEEKKQRLRREAHAI